MNDSISTRVSLLLLVFISLGIYYPAIFAPISSVDDPGMYAYLLNTDNFTLQQIFAPTGGNYYRPVLFLSYMMDKYVWGLEESFMHLENIVLHMLNVVLVFCIARRVAIIQEIRTDLVPFVAALLFAIHPLHTEVVAWIAGRTDLLAGIFLFLSFLLLLRRTPNYWATVFAALSMLIACLAKETAIFFLPAALLCLIMYNSSDSGGESLLYKIRSNLLHIIILISAGMTYFSFRTGAFTRSDAGVTQVLSHVVGESNAGVFHNLQLVLKALGFYVKKLFIPFPLNFSITQIPNLYILFGFLVIIFLIWMFTRRTIVSLLYTTAASIAVSALIIPIIKQTWTPLAERYMYIPSAFFIIGITLSVYQWEKRSQYQTIINIILLLVIGIAIYGTSTRTILWQDNLAFFQDTLNKSPGFVPAQNEVANALYASGKTEEGNTLITSIELPNDLKNREYGLMSKANVHINRGDYVGARRILNEALSTSGKHEVEFLNKLLKIDRLQILAKHATAKSLYPETVKTLSRLIKLTGDPFYSYRLGIVHLQVGERQKALIALNSVVKTATPTAYYYKPAEKLVKDLSGR